MGLKTKSCLSPTGDRNYDLQFNNVLIDFVDLSSSAEFAAVSLCRPNMGLCVWSQWMDKLWSKSGARKVLAVVLLAWIAVALGQQTITNCGELEDKKIPSRASRL